MPTEHSPWTKRFARVARTAVVHCSADDLERRMCEVVAAELADAGAGERVGLYLADLDTASLRLADACAERESLPRQLAIAAEHFVAQTASSLQPVRANGDLGLPLLVADELVGVLALGPVADGAEVPLQAMADILALALGSCRAARQRDEVVARVRRAEIADRAILEALEVVPESQLHVALLRGFHIWPYARNESVPAFIRRAFQTIVDQARAAAGAEIAALGISRSPDKPFEPWVHSGVPAEQVAAVGRAPRPVGALGVVALAGESVRLRDVRMHPAFGGFPAHHPAVTSMLAVPVRYGQMSVGNLYLANKLDAPEFSAADQSIVEGLALHAGQAMQIGFLRTAIEAQRAQLQSTLDCAPSGILFIDADSRHVMANPRAMALIGRTIVPDAGVEQYLDVVCHPDGQPVSMKDALFLAALAGETVRNVEALICSDHGHRIPVLISAAPVRTVDRNILGAVVVFEEISAIKELERTRAEFASIVAHDLRTPLSVIQLQASALLRDVDGNQVRAPLAAVRRIQRSASELVQMTNDLLDATRTELGRFSLDRAEVEADQLTEEIVDTLRLSLGDHPIDVTAESGLPHLMLDRLRFEQLLTNLVDNAGKCSAAGAPISIHLAAAGDGVLVAVRDQGVGIPASEIPMLFDRFYQASRSRSKRSGLGLGLFIAKGIVDAHDGRIWVESEPGRGSTFYVWFPAGSQPHDAVGERST